MNKDSVARKMLLAIFLLWFSVYTYPSFFSAYVQEDLRVSATMVGVITGAYGCTQMLLRVPFGLISDLRRTRKPFLLLGMGASFLAACGLLFWKNQYGALVLRALAGVAASTWVTYSVMYSSCFTHENTGAAMSRLTFMQYLGQLSAMLLGSFLADRVGKDAAFALAAAAGVCGLALTARIPDLPPEGEKPTLRKSFSVLKDRRLRVGTTIAMICNFISWGTVLGFTVNWAKGVIGLSTAQLGLLSAIYFVPNAIFARMSDRLRRLVSRKVLLCAGFSVIAAAAFLFSRTQTALQLFAVQVLYGCGTGVIMPTTMADAIADIPDDRRSVAMGFYQSIYGIGMFLGPVAAGAVVDAFTQGENLVPGYQANFLMMSCVAIVGGLFALLATKTQAKGE